ncbi:hypothetical protein F383_39228 [Gossypium arboreum]|uniref:Uncharacterized protein n=1 Tax=Gossypium arboreum TaxID=29729 RepID=A0A0B0MR21_GOSAR|nr:hypothetical protein F383_39228 [Gossypium arboreum]
MICKNLFILYPIYIKRSPQPYLFFTVGEIYKD